MTHMEPECLLDTPKWYEQDKPNHYSDDWESLVSDDR